MRRQKETEAAVPTHWDVIHWLLQIDPPPSMGDTWPGGMADGIYMAQCHLRGMAQGQAGRGDFALAVNSAKTAVALNALRRFEDTGASA